MTNKELREEVNRLKTALAELGEKVDALPKSVEGGVFKPEYGQEYCPISGRGDVYYGKWENHPEDQRMYAIGNCFPTEQAAIDAVRVLKLIQKAKESQDGFVPEWKDAEKDKHSLSFDGSGFWTTSDPLINTAPIFGYWGDELACELFVEDNHDELIWFFTEYRR